VVGAEAVEETEEEGGGDEQHGGDCISGSRFAGSRGRGFALRSRMLNGNRHKSKHLIASEYQWLSEPASPRTANPRKKKKPRGPKPAGLKSHHVEP
jgi:hypothetical protein